ncbi:pilus assembly PilX family protein [Pseudoduganella violaceinigra]|uniref:pilus assembly PilX family protein n=1 Tax=Pseudoduganella violaceinigra TaxID=246602 RepID=UPI00041D0D45|nr:hypothetical protein [Pseudoduganella violaceinigra]
MNYRKFMGWKALQQGVVLPITLIVLVAMTLAGIAVMRSLDTASVIAGNMAFKQSATASGDFGVEAAITWLAAQNKNKANPLYIDGANATGTGYYATRQDTLDMTGNNTAGSTDNMDWDNAARARTLPADSAGNVVSYVIHRMCNNAGTPDAVSCSMEQTSRSGSSKGIVRQMMTYQPNAWTELANRVYYRVTARITGPRNTTSYVQVVVLI